jgi:FG-GAP-like repeat
VFFRNHHDSCGDSRPRLSSPAKLGSCVQCLTLALAALSALAFAQNPVPQIVGPVKRTAVAPGSGAFTLTVYGANFVSGSVVNWNRQPRTTAFVSAHELQAQILATDVATNTAGLISVTNPAPGGGNSSASWAQVEVHVSTTTVAISKRKQYAIGDWLLMAADFNNDGILDLIGEYGGDLDFYYGKGDGTFHFGSIAGRFYIGVLPGVYGDFNGDGNLDLAFVQGLGLNQPTQMAVMLGDGKGKFSVGSYIKDYSGFGITAVGDFNGDGKLDLITRGKGQLSVFLGKGDGSFQHFKDYPYSALAAQLIVGDFNGDGKLDLVALQSPLPGGNNLGMAFYVLLGNGDGTFKTPQAIGSFPTALGCSGSGVQGDVQLSDFNGDGKLDLAFCNQTQIGILMGNGDGTFQAPVYYTAGVGQQFQFAFEDLNSDGKIDILASRYDSTPQFEVFLGNGDGTFQPPQITNQVSAYCGFVLGDFNSDGVVDFLAPSGLGMQAYIQ